MQNTDSSALVNHGAGVSSGRIGTPTMNRSTSWAIITLILVAVYHVARYAATRCVGSGCDTLYIPLSLLLPVLAWVASIITGWLAWHATPNTQFRARVLIACTVLSTIGPIASLVIFRDNPDQFVVTATISVLICPILVLAVIRPRP